MVTEDVWADVRDWRGWQTASDLRKDQLDLLTDADALLAVVNMAIAYEQTLAPFGSADEGFYHVGDEIALDNFQDAITALPERLKAP